MRRQFSLLFRSALAFVILVASLSAVGCKPGSNSKSKETAPGGDGSPENANGISFSDGQSASKILADVVVRYQSAKTYQDEGILDLSYRMNGRIINEPKRFKTAFDSRGKMAFESFNVHVRANGKVLGCEVNDSDTANLENQTLLIPYDRRVPIEQLFRDAIAVHFATGFAELPLDEKNEASGPKIIPAAVSLLTNQMQNAWLQTPDQCERLADQQLGDRECYVIRTLANDMTCDIWIEKKELAVIKMSLPLKLLAREVVGSPQVTDVVLLARYNRITFDSPIEDSVFEQPVKEDAVWVRKFVSLPEPLTSELIGKPSPKFHLLTPNGSKRDRLSFDQKTLALIWVDGADSIAEIKQWSSTLSKLKLDSKLEVGIVYSESERKRRQSDDIEPLARITDLGQALDVPIFYDPQQSVWTSFKLKTMPVAMVLDGDSNVQFATAIEGDEWGTRLAAAIQRVAKGENVAAEMKEDYARYLDTYYQQLATVSAIDSARRLSGGSKIRQASATTQTGTLTLAPTEAWRCREFKKPGNIGLVLETAADGTKRNIGYAIFDGWQSMGLVSMDGRLLRRETLGLPQNEAATLVRQSHVDQRQSFAVFSPFGSRFYLYDRSFSSPKKIEVGQGSSPSRIRDLRFSDLDGNGTAELLLATEDGNLELLDPVTGDRQSIGEEQCDSMVGFSKDIITLKNGRMKSLKSSEDFMASIATETGWAATQLATLGDQQLLATGKNRAGKWSAVAFDRELKRQWTLEVGPQMFENSLQPISVTPWREDAVWAIADSNHLVQLVTGSGKWIGEFSSETAISGMALSQVDGKVFLTIANEAGVESWSLGISGN